MKCLELRVFTHLVILVVKLVYVFNIAVLEHNNVHLKTEPNGC